MTDLTAVTLARRFYDEFDQFEKILLSPLQVPQFKKFLKTYKGLPQASCEDETECLTQAEQIVGFFQKLLQNVFQEFNGIPIDMDETLKKFEATCNLVLLYWFGDNNKNFQFRTLVHYYNWEGLAGDIFKYGTKEYSLTIFLDGLRFTATEDENRAMYCESIVTPLKKLSPLSEKSIFSRLRTAQNQIIFLTDTWEYRNSVLAVEQGLARQFATQKNDPESYKTAFSLITARRNLLASYCMRCFADFEEWFSDLKQKITLSDTLDEWDATHALLLSAAQKIFLPGSISRHVFSEDFQVECYRWVNARVNNTPHDFSAKLFLVQLQILNDGTTNLQSLVDTLYARDQDWSLCYDPCTPLKAFSWKYGALDHIRMCQLTLIALAKKNRPHPLSTFWLENIAAYIQMPETFSVSNVSASDVIRLSNETTNQLREEAKKTLAAISISDESQDLVRFIEKELELI